MVLADERTGSELGANPDRPFARGAHQGVWLARVGGNGALLGAY